MYPVVLRKFPSPNEVAVRDAGGGRCQEVKLCGEEEEVGTDQPGALLVAA